MEYCGGGSLQDIYHGRNDMHIDTHTDTLLSQLIWGFNVHLFYHPSPFLCFSVPLPCGIPPVTGPLSESQIAYMSRETLQVEYIYSVPDKTNRRVWEMYRLLHHFSLYVQAPTSRMILTVIGFRALWYFMVIFCCLHIKVCYPYSDYSLKHQCCILNVYEISFWSMFQVRE